MNHLIYQDYFQFVLNQFLIIDKDIVSWKLVCRSNYYYTHDICIKKIDTKKCDNVLDNTNIIEIDTKLYIERSPIYWFKECACGLSDHIKSTFDIKFLYRDMSKLKKLIVSYTNSTLFAVAINNLSSLEYLDLGINTFISDDLYKFLPNLQVLYLRNNNNSKQILEYLPKLHTIQIGYDIDCREYNIKPKDIPERIKIVIQEGYSYTCPINGWRLREGCEPIYQHAKYTIVIRPEKN